MIKVSKPFYDDGCFAFIVQTDDHTGMIIRSAILYEGPNGVDMKEVEADCLNEIRNIYPDAEFQTNLDITLG